MQDVKLHTTENAFKAGSKKKADAGAQDEVEDLRKKVRTIFERGKDGQLLVEDGQERR